MEHHFNVEIAEIYGILEAVILNHFDFWIRKNEANGNNFHNGYYWTYNSRRAFQEIFPYASQKQIRNALEKLESEGLIQTGNFNDMAYDRTLWYAFTEKGKCIMQKGQMDYAETANGLCQNGKPIPDNDTDKKTDNNTYMGKQAPEKQGVENRGVENKRFKAPTLDEVLNYCKERKNGVNAQRFIDYYTANGWKVGRNPMKDWKAAVRTWERGSEAKVQDRDDSLDDIF